MSSTSVTRYEVRQFFDDRWKTIVTAYDRKTALERAELLNKTGAKWCIWKLTERSEMIGKG